MYECFHCLQKSVIWDSDFDFEDYGYDGEGVVHVCHCANCGADIEYTIRMEIKINKKEELLCCVNFQRVKYVMVVCGVMIQTTTKMR